ncbi:hypothetical protein M662_15755 [Bacillus sp. SB49]|nr:hypothetical protein D479_02707 [Halobacillus sp. BAB-2008]QHT47875.1 hypothetical protein M662_15755 [Bacillus sp. SB49]
MLKRFLPVCVLLLLAVSAALLAARNPTGPNTISYEEPMGLWLSIGMIVVLFLPPLILALFQSTIARVTSAVYQGIVVFSFLVIIPIGFFVPDQFSVGVAGVAGTAAGVWSIILTLKTGEAPKPAK